MVEKLYSQCVVSHVPPIITDAAHIVPRTICKSLGLKDWEEDPYNGLMLSKTLHCLFDRYMWTFDIYDWEPDPDPAIIRIRSLITLDNIPQSVSREISGPFRIYKMSLKYLVIHYHIYLLQHGLTPQKTVTLQDYSRVIREESYQIRCIDNNPPEKMLPVCALRQRYNREQEILWRGYPYHLRSWIPVR